MSNTYRAVLEKLGKTRSVKLNAIDELSSMIESALDNTVRNSSAFEDVLDLFNERLRQARESLGDVNAIYDEVQKFKDANNELGLGLDDKLDEMTRGLTDLEEYESYLETMESIKEQLGQNY